MSPKMRRAKLAKLRDIEGFEDENDLFAAAISDSVCPAICCNSENPNCDYTAEMEPDQDQGFCEACGARFEYHSCRKSVSNPPRVIRHRSKRRQKDSL